MLLGAVRRWAKLSGYKGDRNSFLDVHEMFSDLIGNHEFQALAQRAPLRESEIVALGIKPAERPFIKTVFDALKHAMRVALRLDPKPEGATGMSTFEASMNLLGEMIKLAPEARAMPRDTIARPMKVEGSHEDKLRAARAKLTPKTETVKAAAAAKAKADRSARSTPPGCRRQNGRGLTLWPNPLTNLWLHPQNQKPQPSPR